MSREAELLEKEACDFFAQENFTEAFRLFTKAAEIYKREGSHQKSALCFASAAGCWSKKSGEIIFANAAKSYETAAKQAETSGDFEYAAVLYRYAAINYERDREFSNFSDCFYRSKECYRKFLNGCIIGSNKRYKNKKIPEEKGTKGSIGRLATWFFLTISFVIWGHGERPARTFFCAMLVVFLSAFLYTFGRLLGDGVIFQPEFVQAFYFSAVTFTTLGYGDISPIGWSKLIVVIEAFSGLFIIPIFLIGLSRKYLRL